MKNKIIFKVFTFFSCVSLLLSACNNDSKTNNYSNDQIYQIYQLALSDGYEGTYEQWLESIKGKDGENGHTPVITIGDNGNWFVDEIDTGVKAQGEPGNDGANGKSVYELYCDAHPEYVSTEEQWLDDMINGRLREKEKCTVSFDSNGGSEVPSQEVAKDGKAGKPKDPIKNGYTFVDWADENGDHWVFNGFTITSDITLYARWEANYYTIHLDPNGGVLPYTELEVQYLGNFVLPKIQRDGYSFVGWYLDDVIINDGIYVYTNDITLKAKWDAPYIIHFNSDGGTPFEDLEGTILNEIDSLPIPTKEESQFIGWYYNDGLVNTPFYYDFPSLEVTFTARYKQVSGDYELRVLESDKAEIIKYNGDDSQLVIPSVLSGKTVVSIADEVFKNNSRITKIILPESLLTIGNETFADMPSLDEIIFNDALTTVGENILTGTRNLSKLTMTCGELMLKSFFGFEDDNIPTNLVITLTYNAKKYVTANNGPLKNIASNVKYDIVLDNSWTFIPSRSFESCSRLRSIFIPESIKTIDDYAFQSCLSLTSIVIPENVTTIGRYSFAYCDSLMSVSLPNSLTSISDGCFHVCKSLTSIIVPNGISLIGSYAFSNCYDLNAVFIAKSVNTINNSSFFGTRITKVHYEGSQDEWNKVQIGARNDPLINASFVYNSTIEIFNAQKIVRQ